jgi:hypothetical protein
MADHGRRILGAGEDADDAGPDLGERGRLRLPRVLLPDEPPLLTPAAAAVLLRILRRAGDRVREHEQPTAGEERRAA